MEKMIEHALTKETQTLIDAIKHALTKETQTLIDAIKVIGGGRVSVELRMARAAMIEALIIREGEELADALMDQLGM
jgi:hypothetical protein